MRCIARLDIKNGNVIKGIHLEGLRIVGNPVSMARSYYEQGIEEVFLLDAVASLYGTNHLYSVVEAVSSNVFVPIAVGGGIRSLSDVEKALAAGADKVVINTAAFENLRFIESVAERFGSQCVVGSVQAKAHKGDWLAYYANGKERSNVRAIDWACSLESAGAGELIITSIDKEGTRRGFDTDLIESIVASTKSPIVVSGGFGKPEHLSCFASCRDISGVAIASVLHYNLLSIESIKLHRDGCLL